ncbi:MAG: hypothetical protein VX278_23995, partial [Myxococcota bacterium]|nr:hypothetical protein [Myxococcota bacterium]
MNNRQQLLFFSLFLSACSNNEKPHCDITDPISSSAYLLGQNILFQARSSDNEQNNHKLNVAWESDLDGVFNTTPPNTEGEIGFVYNGLSAGNHTITLRVEDDRGALYADTVLLTVRTAPLIDILSPENGSLHGLNSSVPFKVNVEDPEDLSQEISLLWESSIDGEFSDQGPDANGDVEFSFRDFSPGVHNIRVTATDTTGLTDSAYINIRINTPPTAPQVEISPQEPSTNESLSANVFGSVDADGEEINYQYQWLKNGNPTSFASTSIHASATSVGDVWTLRATPSDGYTEGQYGEASVIVTNTKPNISNVRITPINANNDTIVTCNAIASDADQEVSPTYRWLIDDLSYAGAVLDLSTTSARPGEVVTCVANVTDDEGAIAESSASITLQNREPLISDITISPSEIYTGTQVNCAAAAMDPDEGPLLPTYRWTLGNQVLSTSSSYAVQASETNVGEELTCTVTATDSAGLIASNSASVTIENTIPAITDIQITPNGTVYNDSSVTCVANAVDPDEPLSVNYEWKQNGNPLKTGSMLDLSVYSIHPTDHIECIASVTDASGAFVAANVSTNVDNRPPVVDYVALSDAKPKADALIECSASVSDPDGEALLPSYEWTRNGVDIGDSASLQLDPSIATVGAPLTCTAFVTDAAGASANASASATIDNTEPTMSPVAIQPESNLHVNSELTCSATGYDFNDGALTPTYTWTNTTNGIVVGNAQTLQLDSSFVSAGDIIECTITFTDNDGASVQDRFSVEVLNGSPSFDSAAEITPNTMVKTGTTVVCSANATDPEEGALSPTYTWSLGSQILSTTNTYTVSALETNVGDQLTCTASVNDDTGETATTTAHVTIENTEPIIDFISLSSSEVYNDDPLECIATVVDPDELQPLTISYEWSIASALIGSGTSLDLAATTSNPGSTVVCTATTTDSQGATTSGTAEASITNRLPTAPSVSISPETPTAGQDPLVCT